MGNGGIQAALKGEDHGNTPCAGVELLPVFSSFRELFDHLHARWKQDRVPDRRLILVLDALNEAPFAEKVVREALDLVGLVACYPWCKVVISTRQEWLSLWSGKLGAQEASPLRTYGLSCTCLTRVFPRIGKGRR